MCGEFPLSDQYHVNNATQCPHSTPSFSHAEYWFVFPVNATFTVPPMGLNIAFSTWIILNLFLEKSYINSDWIILHFFFKLHYCIFQNLINFYYFSVGIFYHEFARIAVYYFSGIVIFLRRIILYSFREINYIMFESESNY